MLYNTVYRDYVVTCMLTIGDDKLAMEDNNASLEVAREGHMQECLVNSHRWASR